jgi:hypothetical protein
MDEDINRAVRVYRRQSTLVRALTDPHHPTVHMTTFKAFFLAFVAHAALITALPTNTAIPEGCYVDGSTQS